MRPARPRLAVRAAVMDADRLLIVNAYPGDMSDLWALPGGGVEPGQSLPENLMREVEEETGLTIAVGAPFLINELHDPETGWHQVEIFFRATCTGGQVRFDDPDGVVNRLRWVTRQEMATLRHKPDSVIAAVWGDADAIYDRLEPVVT